MKKRSAQVTLVMLGTAAMLAACSPSPDDDEVIEVKQETYATQSDCQADWGNDPSDCVKIEGAPQDNPASGPATHPTGAAYTGARYYGPRYYWDRENMVPRSFDNPDRAYPSSAAAKNPPTVESSHAQARAYAGSRAVGRVTSVARAGFGGHAGSSGG